MQKKFAIILTGLLCLGLVGCSFDKKNINNTNINNITKNYKAEDLKKLSDDVHEKVENKPSVIPTEIDINDKEMLTMTTGLKSNTNVEYVVSTESVLGSQAYAFVLVKVTDNANIEKMKIEMIENIDLGKWICVFADKAYVTNYGNIIMLVMGDTKVVDVDGIYNGFETVSNNNVGKKLEKIGEK